MTSKQEYIAALNKMSSKSILSSLRSPNPFMKEIHVSMHKIVLRRRGLLFDT